MGKARKNGITGIQVDKLDRATMEAALTKLGWEAPDQAEMSDDQLSTFLYTKFIEGTPGGKGEDFLICENCGGGSPEDKVEDCPYCNDKAAPTATEVSSGSGGNAGKAPQGASQGPSSPGTSGRSHKGRGGKGGSMFGQVKSFLTDLF